jgi:predicted HTH domain antitoxin
MQITLPPGLEEQLDAQQVLLDLATGMYAGRHVTLGRGAEIAGITQIQFQRELAGRKIPLHYDREDLAIDLQAVRELSGP